jgi:hypothetical protein
VCTTRRYRGNNQRKRRIVAGHFGDRNFSAEAIDLRCGEQAGQLDVV